MIVPNGWSDWMVAIQIIADSAKDAGIRITPAYPDYNGLVDERDTGKFELVINNDKQIGNTPYTYYDYLFHLPVAEKQTFANFRGSRAARAVGADAKLNKMKTSDVAEGEEAHSADPEGDPEDLPAIPLWYNGMWAQYNNRSGRTSRLKRHRAPDHAVVWNGYLNMTGIEALARLKKK